MKPTRILLADDHALVRAGIHALLDSIANTEVVAEAGDGHETLATIARQLPDVVFLDITMPGMNGLEALARIREDFPSVRVIILSMNAAEPYVLQAVRAGAAGYLLKQADARELEIALRAVMRGETYLSPAVSKHVVTDYVRRAGTEPSLLDRLTPRQREVLQLLAEGQSSKEVARRLNVSVKTVMSHRSQLMEQLGIHDMIGLLRFAIRAGLVAPE